MTQEEKQLLLKDLCARLPYEYIRCKWIVESFNPDTFDKELEINEVIISFIESNKNNVHLYGKEVPVDIGEIRPYLRPISSMTEDEMDKLFDVLHIDKDGNDEDWIKINDILGIKFFFPTGKWVENVAEAYDYLNSIHIDYRGLIEKGLALEAPEDMYKI